MIDLKKSFLFANIICAATMLWFSPLAIAQAWPTKPIKLIVPYTPGGSNDILARLSGQGLQNELKQTVVVENRPGAGGTIGLDYVLRSPADGYTLVIFGSPAAVLPTLYPEFKFNVYNDLEPISMVQRGAYAIAVSSKSPANTLAEFIAVAKANPGKLNYGTNGPGFGQLYADKLKAIAGVNMIEIPYKGVAEAMTGLLGGDIDLFANTPAVLKQHLTAGKIKILAYAGRSRLNTLPGIPTTAEAGLPLAIEFYTALFAPKKTPASVITDLARALGDIDQNIRSKFVDATGFPYSGAGPDVVKQQMAEELRLLVTENAKPS